MRKPKRRAADGRRSYKIDPVSVWSVTILLCAAVFACAYVLFQNVVICAAVTAVLLIPVRRKVRKEAELKYEKQVRAEFVSCLVMISGSLASGLRLEQCVNEIAAGDTREYRRLRPEFIRMSKLIQLNWPAERAFAELASRIPVAEIRLFSQALNYGVPTGVNLIELVRSFSSGVRIRNDVEAEISRTLNLPKYNNRIIMCTPFVMIAIMRITAADYLRPLESGTGFIVKTAAAAAILIALVLGELLGDINYAE
ncbi:MAG: hypothetical protein IKI42_02855 [Clostridia bacterium]|nr:hypothetical protein [Clostridia bacterium]